MALGALCIEDLLKNGVVLFEKEFHEYPSIAVSAPGRINLIGEHTDYNDGFVMPMALPLVTIMIGKINNSSIACIRTEADVGNEERCVKIVLSEKEKIAPGNPKWANYIRGVIHYFNCIIPGFNAVVVSSLPLGSGLSSSAALEVSTYTFLETLTGCKTTNLKEKATICQKAEHNFANVPCGLMDQYISVLGQTGQALFLDCKTHLSELIPFARPDVVILIINSNVHHYLNASNEYAKRRDQCAKAIKILGIKSLREATLAMLEVRQNELDDLVFRRARHVITEIERTSAAAKALKNEDYFTFGHLMNASHRSLRDDYNVSCSEVDQLVEISLNCEGVFGSRMTGAGFGGCVITLLRNSFVNELIAKIKAEYKGNATFYIASASHGAQDETPILHKLISL